MELLKPEPIEWRAFITGNGRWLEKKETKVVRILLGEGTIFQSRHCYYRFLLDVIDTNFLLDVIDTNILKFWWWFVI